MSILNQLSLSRHIFFICILFALFPTSAFAQQSGITSPATGASVNGALPIFGTAVIEPFQKYELHYKAEPSGEQDYKYFDGDTQQVTNGQLGVLQAGGFAPGIYSIRLRVVKQDGNYAEYFAQNISINQEPQAPPTALPTVPPPTRPPIPTATLAPPPTLPPPSVATATATLVTVGSIGIITTPTASPLPREATETPIPTQTFTPAPQPTPAVGQVTQPQVETNILPTRTPLPTYTPIQVAAVEDVPQSSANNSLSTSSESVGSAGAESAEAEAAADNVVDAGQSAASSAAGSETGNSVSGGVSNQASVSDSAQSNSAQSNSAQSASGSGASSSITRQLGEALAFERLQTYFFDGMRYSSAIIFLIILLFISKRLFGWIRSQV